MVLMQASAASVPFTAKCAWKYLRCSTCSWKWCGVSTAERIGTVVSTLMSLQLETNVPILSAVLTPHHFHEHVEHRKYFHAHFAVKGTEAADACIRTIEGLRQVEALLVA